MRQTRLVHGQVQAATEWERVGKVFAKHYDRDVGLCVVEMCVVCVMV